MNHEVISRIAQANIGKVITIRYGGNTDSVFIVSVDTDGFICRSPGTAQDPPLEWWISFSDVSEVVSIAMAS
jgi:hypothetical protein